MEGVAQAAIVKVSGRLVHELLIGPIFYRLLLTGAPLDRGLGKRLVDSILEGFRASPV